MVVPRLAWHRSVLVLAVAALLSACATASQQDVTPSDGSPKMEDVIPLTAANIRGHQMLYDQGWFVITSSKHAFEYAAAHGGKSAGEAWRQAQQAAARATSSFAEAAQQDTTHTIPRIQDRLATGTDTTRSILKGTADLVKGESAFAKKELIGAWDSLIRGYLTIGQRTAEDRRELQSLGGETFGQLRSDFSNLWDMTKALHAKFAGRIHVSWEESFKQASEEFRSEYDRSVEKDNSLYALGPILSGYFKALYHGAAVPAAKTLVHLGASAGATSTGAVFLPTASTVIVTGRTIQASGLTLYYSSAIGLKLLSPTLESGMLSGLALLAGGSVPLTALTGGTVGAVNQVAFTAGAPAYTVGETAVNLGRDTGKYVGLVTYSELSGATKVLIHEAASGVVLGYNALSAIPAHLLMGVVDSAVLLAWEGPHLVLVKLSGKGQRPSASTTQEESRRPDALPVGTVVDMSKVRQSDDLSAEVISRDPQVIRDVIERAPCDLGEERDACSPR